MLTWEAADRPTASRIKGRPALVKRLRLLLIAVHRYGRGRARRAEDLAWSARVIDSLTTALETATGDRS